jgi:HD-GYP domain-containing protein (c-di-GMP phosphodiesterase class II)
MSEKLKRREQYYALIKVIKDPQFPENDGTYKIFKFGYKIKEKIDEELKPAFGEPTQVFDLFEGKNFELIITRQGDYNNYDKSKFSASKSAISVDGKTAEKTKEVMSAIKAELDKAPSLEPYEYKPWDDEARDFVNSILRQYLNPGSAMDEIVNTKKATTKATAAAKAQESSDDFDFDTTSAPAATATTSSVDSSDDLDAFLNDLDI